MPTLNRCEKCTVGVPSCRTDVIPFFNKHGYKVSCGVACGPPSTTKGKRPG